jgi:biopolymer transport protein ExbB
VKPADATRSATLFAQQDGTNAIAVLVEQGKVFARVLGVETAKVDLPVGGWHHVALTVGDRAVLYVDGIEAGSAAAKAVEMAGEFTIGAGFAGEIDELQLANVPRSAAWIAAAVASQGEAAKLVKVSTESEAGEGGEDASYLGILLSAVTLDGWIVIGILMVMMVVSFAVMILKSVFLARMDSANKAFQKRFADIVDLLDATGETKGQQHASLARLYEIASRELRKRVGTQGTGAVVSGKAIDAIRASLDAQVVRESARLNSQMVLLTISISGGPFLGLLGTVVGVMITFAAIAAAGDVNVNSIAPGIAAALVATVAGLAVAIPALFGYNYLASRIKTISADMHVFVDEVTTRIAERYAD